MDSVGRHVSTSPRPWQLLGPVRGKQTGSVRSTRSRRPTRRPPRSNGSRAGVTMDLVPPQLKRKKEKDGRDTDPGWAVTYVPAWPTADRTRLGARAAQTAKSLIGAFGRPPPAFPHQGNPQCHIISPAKGQGRPVVRQRSMSLSRSAHHGMPSTRPHVAPSLPAGTFFADRRRPFSETDRHDAVPVAGTRPTMCPPPLLLNSRSRRPVRGDPTASPFASSCGATEFARAR